MLTKRETESVYLKEESVIKILLVVLSTNNLYTYYLQTVAESISSQEEVRGDE